MVDQAKAFRKIKQHATLSFQSYCFILAWAVLSLTLLSTQVFSSEKPNVVIFFTDDQGTLDANCYGSKDLFTPHMDALATEGIRFTQAYAHQVCCPARAMLLTGRYPQRSNVNHWTQGNAKGKKTRNMNLDEVTLAEALQKAGYKTALFGKWHLGADLEHGPTKQGFDTFFGIRGGFIDNYNHYFLHGHGFHDLYEGTKEIFSRDQYFPDLMTRRAIEYIDEHKTEAFFMFVSFNIPHYPEQADAKFDKLYQDLPMPRRSYAKMISTTDDRMGQIIARLKHHKIKENTIILFMSDNGHSAEEIKIRSKQHNSGLKFGLNYGANGGGGNTGKWIGHKGTFLEGGIRVPTILSYAKKVPKGEVRDEAITAMDWMPTLLDLCQVPHPQVSFDGKSILPIIASPNAKSEHQTMHWKWSDKWAVRRGEWKLIGKGNQALSLGNLADPKPELKNYLHEKPELAKELLAIHQQWLKKVEAQ